MSWFVLLGVRVPQVGNNCTRWIFVKFNFAYFYENLSRKSKFGYNKERIWHFTWIPNYVLLLLAKYNRRISADFRVQWYQVVSISEELYQLSESATILLHSYTTYIVSAWTLMPGQNSNLIFMIAHGRHASLTISCLHTATCYKSLAFTVGRSARYVKQNESTPC